ncbi:YdeI/OmpD-associated family protein [Geodermatophilus sp. YIM 151500]|uniref:YdeI/OmpD-associated family protein n=1 Tax=Geodermatophilus sp. YIM 151500 TaxID=2984531 RepID=UPI0021E3A620|nr:YdeI/OmpD-associated family protein [Geodermatophilus sp. YIM 151500]MCV2489418.1 YdeI/OmpD-associated family protein [Geodermatophilus sp. YIM 151500]
MTAFRDRPRVHAETVEQWRRWLAEHADAGDGVWLVSWKAATGRPRLSYDEAVTEALAHGWVDSRPAALDDERSMLWFSPRKPGSAWSRPNKERVERLLAEGRMRPGGQAAVDAARASGTWSLLDEVEDGVVPGDLAAALAAHDGARANWDAFPRSVRRGIHEWIVQARRPETRRARVEETAALAARGERANQWPRR